MSEVKPGFVLRRLRNETGTPFKIPSVGIVLESGDEADIVYSADQAVPHGFAQVGKDIACTEDGTPLEGGEKPAAARKGKTADAASSDAPSTTADKASE